MSHSTNESFNESYDMLQLKGLYGNCALNILDHCISVYGVLCNSCD